MQNIQFVFSHYIETLTAKSPRKVDNQTTQQKKSDSQL